LAPARRLAPPWLDRNRGSTSIRIVLSPGEESGSRGVIHRTATSEEVRDRHRAPERRGRFRSHGESKEQAASPSERDDPAHEPSGAADGLLTSARSAPVAEPTSGW
jgi:hypothetical protein